MKTVKSFEYSIVGNELKQVPILKNNHTMEFKVFNKINIPDGSNIITHNNSSSSK